MNRYLLLMVVFSFFCYGCASWFTIGESDFSCPHVRTNSISCMPPSEVEKLDRRGELDWKWHPYGKELKEKELCTLSNLKIYMQYCSQKEYMNAPVCRKFENLCLGKEKVEVYGIANFDTDLSEY